MNSRLERAPIILLRSSWQVVNIGDIAHTPGALALIERHFPEAEVILWASDDLTDEVAAMEHRRFPQLRIVKGRIGEDGRVEGPELEEAIDGCDFLLHGSGPWLVASDDVAAFRKRTGKPYGVFGISYNDDPAVTELLSEAEFVYFRDTVSLERAKAAGVACPTMAFGPDAAFSCDVRDDERADRFLQANGLVPGEFLCCIPKLRYTPYWTIRNSPFDTSKHARNEAMKEHDHAQLREAILAVVRETGRKVLICPEDMTEVAVGKEMLYDKLPEDVRSQVVWRPNFWLTDEAISVYVRSAGLFGNEMHSPILCVAHGVPAIVCRWAEQTVKGWMWSDIGLRDWLFDLDNEDEVRRIVPTVLEMARHPERAKARAAEALVYVRERQRVMMETLRAAVHASVSQAGKEEAG
ncbi:polysaccharide pyruvyl transferase family protein [Paenibacillus sp.]|uniref:polysaccharide pyruvyl transferase family protein n=1 Tax=Paenibacillus sp. TaxID=58172 RepID=UPI00281111F1|nr:polysaccharide pyruvyl transferase family protein [Paenibacillus sp.]